MASYMTSTGGTLRKLSSAIPRAVRCRGTIRMCCYLPLKIALGSGYTGSDIDFSERGRRNRGRKGGITAQEVPMWTAKGIFINRTVLGALLIGLAAIVIQGQTSSGPFHN